MTEKRAFLESLFAYMPILGRVPGWIRVVSHGDPPCHCCSPSQVLKPCCIPKEINLRSSRNSGFCQAINCTRYRSLFNKWELGRSWETSSHRERRQQQPEVTEAAPIWPLKDRKWNSKWSAQHWNLLDTFCTPVRVQVRVLSEHQPSLALGL